MNFIYWLSAGSGEIGPGCCNGKAGPGSHFVQPSWGGHSQRISMLEWRPQGQRNVTFPPPPPPNPYRPTCPNSASTPVKRTPCPSLPNPVPHELRQRGSWFITKGCNNETQLPPFPCQCTRRVLIGGFVSSYKGYGLVSSHLPSVAITNQKARHKTKSNSHKGSWGGPKEEQSVEWAQQRQLHCLHLVRRPRDSTA